MTVCCPSPWLGASSVLAETLVRVKRWGCPAGGLWVACLEILLAMSHSGWRSLRLLWSVGAHRSWRSESRWDGAKREVAAARIDPWLTSPATPRCSGGSALRLYPRPVRACSGITYVDVRTSGLLHKARVRVKRHEGRADAPLPYVRGRPIPRNLGPQVWNGLTKGSGAGSPLLWPCFARGKVGMLQNGKLSVY